MKVINEKIYPIQLLAETKSSVVDNIDIVLDIGCGLPMDLFECQFHLQAKTLIGIDKKPQKELINESNRVDYLRCKDFQECHNFYLNNIEKIIEDNEEYKKQFSSFNKKELLKSFDKKFKFFNYSFEDLNIVDLENNFGKFDLIILSNVLHFVPYQTALDKLIDLVDCLNFGGNLLLVLNHSDNQSMTDKDIADNIGQDIWRNREKDETVYLYSDNRFQQLIEKLKEKKISSLFEAKEIDDSQKGKSLWLVAEKR